MDDPYRRTTFTPAVFYKDPFAALDWLEKVFGFARSMVITTKDGKLAHAEMRFEEGLVYIGSEWSQEIASPVALGGKNTQMVHVHLSADIDAHFAHAKAAGADILMEPEDQFYGDRTYRVRDLEGHVWSFGQNLRFVSREDAEAASGLKIEGWI